MSTEKYIQYYMFLINGSAERAEVIASDEVHEQLRVILQSVGKLRSLMSELYSVENQIVQARSWLEAAIEKTSMQTLFDKEQL